MNDITNNKELVEVPFDTSEGEVAQPEVPAVEGEVKARISTNS